jgi:hypothetical protein
VKYSCFETGGHLWSEDALSSSRKEAQKKAEGAVKARLILDKWNKKKG